MPWYHYIRKYEEYHNSEHVAEFDWESVKKRDKAHLSQTIHIQKNAKELETISMGRMCGKDE